MNERWEAGKVNRNREISSRVGELVRDRRHERELDRARGPLEHARSRRSSDRRGRSRLVGRSSAERLRTSSESRPGFRTPPGGSRRSVPTLPARAPALSRRSARSSPPRPKFAPSPTSTSSRSRRSSGVLARRARGVACSSGPSPGRRCQQAKKVSSNGRWQLANVHLWTSPDRCRTTRRRRGARRRSRPVPSS
jgi:hypothetical protein